MRIIIFKSLLTVTKIRCFTSWNIRKTYCITAWTNTLLRTLQLLRLMSSKEPYTLGWHSETTHIRIFMTSYKTLINHHPEAAPSKSDSTINFHALITLNIKIISWKVELARNIIPTWTSSRCTFICQSKKLWAITISCS